MALKYWSKLEDAGDVTNPEIGPAGTEDGSPTYAACKFNNGIYVNVDNEGYHFPNNPTVITGATKGAVEFWIKPDFNLVNGEPSDSARHFLFAYSPAGSAVLAIEVQATGGIRIVRVDDIGGTVAILDTTTDWTAGDLVHLAFTWDKDHGFDGNKTMAFYVNGVETVSTTTALGTLTDDTSDIYVGIHGSGAFHMDSVLDNLKIFDDAKIDFSDRNDEDAGYPTVVGGGSPMLFGGGVTIG